MISYLVLLSVLIAQCIALPNLFKAAGIDSWKGYLPFYNWFIWTKLIQAPWWWALLLFVPGVNLVMLAVFNVQTASSFNRRSNGDNLQAIFIPMIFLPRLAFDKNLSYVGPIDWKAQQAKGVKKGFGREWGHAIVFAVVAASIIRTFFFEAYTIPTPSMEKTLLVGDYLFVSKLSYGAKLPETPVAMPFVHHTLPFTVATPAYLEWLQLPYLRLPGFGSVKRFDPVVFNFPDGDTVFVANQAQGFNQVIRDKAVAMFGPNFTDAQFAEAKQFALKNDQYVVRPNDKKENYIKSCVGLPGENLEVRSGQVFINGKAAETPEHMQYGYNLKFAGPVDPTTLKLQFNISVSDFQGTAEPDVYNVALEPATAERLKVGGIVSFIERSITPLGFYLDKGLQTFPNNRNYNWSEDQYGPIHIPKKGEKIDLNLGNLPLYEKIIRDYECNTLTVSNGAISINGKIVSSYTFKQNYYWMMGDNRHRSADSRFWGFVPEDHIVGKAVFIWFSKDPETGVRWKRLFSLAN